jgi:lipid A 3-O-deacylase
MRYSNQCILMIVGIGAASSLFAAQPDLPATNSISRPAATFAPPAAGIWQGETGEGFRSSVQTLTLVAGATAGFQVFGGYPVLGEDHWYRGNWEIRGEFFGGAQFSPSTEWLLGLTPHLRYNLATGTRWIPFIDGGAGVTATGIGPPDLSGTFEFNIQGNLGVNWFLRDNLALTFQAGYLHMSCAGIHYPNQGLNCATGMVGITWFF